jgi:hypothetical protein
MGQFFRITLTAFESTPPARIPKSKAIVQLHGSKGNDARARQRAGQIAEREFTAFLGRNKIVRKVASEVEPIDKPAALPMLVTAFPAERAALWFVLE